MSQNHPVADDKYPIVFIEDTDIDLPDHVINNKMRYGEFKTIGKGGKCVIQSCKDYHLSRTVCYKSLHAEIANNPQEQKRFLREARVTAMLQHPNTIPVYQLGRDTRGHYYFTMKLVEGIAVREIIIGLKNKEPAMMEKYTVDVLVEILIQVCNALDYAHNHGVVHRDVKPGNVLIGPFGEVLLLDWGLAKVWGMEDGEDDHHPEAGELHIYGDRSLTAQGKLQATPLYMSPEQIKDAKSIDLRTDIYSVGATLYEMLCYEPPNIGETTLELLTNIKTVMPPAPSERLTTSDIPPVLETICMKCLAKDPSDRYQCMEELIDDLKAWSYIRTPE